MVDALLEGVGGPTIASAFPWEPAVHPRALEFTPIVPPIVPPPPLEFTPAEQTLAAQGGAPHDSQYPTVRFRFKEQHATSTTHGTACEPKASADSAELHAIINKLEADLKRARSATNTLRIEHAPLRRERDALAATLKAMGKGRGKQMAEAAQAGVSTRSDPESPMVQELAAARIEADDAHRNRLELSRCRGEAKRAGVKLRAVKAQMAVCTFQMQCMSKELVGVSSQVNQEQERSERLRESLVGSAFEREVLSKGRKEMGGRVRALEAQRAAIDKALAMATSEASDLQAKLDEVQGERDELAAEVASSQQELRGRPAGYAGRAAIEAKWATYGKLASRNKAILRHKDSIVQVLKDGGCTDWLPASLAGALETAGVLDELWATKLFARRRLQFAKELAEVLQAEWNVELALYIKNDVELSDSQYAKLRLAFSKEYNGKAWQKRVWYRCPVLGQELPMPQPLVSRHHWFPIWHSLSTFARPDKLRLKHQLRTRHLKCDMVEEPGAIGGGGRGGGSTLMLTVVSAAAKKV